MTHGLPIKPPVVLLPAHSYAWETGGEIADVHGFDYGEALERVIGDLRGRYSLAFVPEADRRDGKVHRLTVSVAVPRKKGKPRQLEVRTRQAYLAAEPRPGTAVEAPGGEEGQAHRE